MSEHKTTVDIPQLLIKAGLVSTHDLSEAIQVSKRLQSPVSRILLQNGTFNETILWLAIDLQHLMDEDLINLESAINSLKRVASGASTPDQVLDEIYSLPRFGQGSAVLAELLRASKIVTSEQIEYAAADAKHSGSSLGSCLILRGALSAGFFPAILRLQEHVRKAMPVEEAARLLNEEYEVWKRAEASQRHADLQSEATTGPQASPAMPSYNRNDPPTPARPAEPELSSVAKVEETFAPPAASEGLAAAAPRAKATPKASNQVTKLVQLSGLCQDDDLNAAYERALSDPILAAKLFAAAGILSQKDLENLLYCHDLLLRDELTVSEAARALNLSKTRNVPIEHVLKDLGAWTETRARQERWRGALGGFAAGCLTGVASLAVWLVVKRRPR